MFINLAKWGNCTEVTKDKVMKIIKKNQTNSKAILSYI